MSQDHRDKRFDDTEIRSKMELIADLRVHQEELEMQNRELREAEQQLEESRDRYADLYDYAPVGYLTLSKTGQILAINLTGSAMLGKARASIAGRSLINYIAQDEKLTFVEYLRQVFSTSGNTVVELRITGPSDNAKYVRLESSVVKQTDTCRMVMTDIDQLKETTSQNQELLSGNRRLMQNLFKIQEEERRLLARELHDELGQWLTAIHAEAETIASCSDKASTVYACSKSINQCGKKMHAVMRNMLHQLRPVLLDTLGLADALLELKKEWCTHHKQISLEFELEGSLEQLGEHINITIFRITQEALNNICSHAEATWARVYLSRQVDEASATDVLVLSVEDNGKGYNPGQTSSGGFGLLGMRERTIAAGGEFTIHSVPNNGTQIHVRIPLNDLIKKRRVSDR